MMNYLKKYPKRKNKAGSFLIAISTIRLKSVHYSQNTTLYSFSSTIFPLYPTIHPWLNPACQWNLVHFCYSNLGMSQKSSSTYGQAIERGGDKGRAIKEKNLFLKLFEEKIRWPLSSREGGVKALIAWPLVETFCAALLSQWIFKILWIC